MTVLELIGLLSSIATVQILVHEIVDDHSRAQVLGRVKLDGVRFHQVADFLKVFFADNL